MPKGVFGVTGTPVYDPASGFVYVGRDRQAVGAQRAHRRAARRLADPAADRPVPRARVGRDRARQRPRLHGPRVVLRPPALQRARALGRPRSPATVDHQWVVVNTVGGDPGGGGIWGWGGVAITADGHVWAASANANTAEGDAREPRPRRVDHRAQLVARAAQLDATPRACRRRATSASARRRSSSRPTGCGTLVASEGKDGAVYLWPRAKIAGGAGAAPRDRVPGDALRLARLGSADPAAVRDDLAVLRRASTAASTRSRSRRAASCAWPGTASLGGQLNAVPTVVNNTVVVATGTGQLRVYATKTGKLSRSASSAARSSRRRSRSAATSRS